MAITPLVVKQRKREYEKGKWVYAILCEMVHKKLKIKDVAQMCGISYGSLRNGFRDTRQISLKRLQHIHETLSK